MTYKKENHGKSNCQGRAHNSRHEPSVFDRKDHPIAHLRMQILEGRMLRLDIRVARRQGHGA